MRRNGESGYALMMVFLMAAVIAITLYNEIPRVAFQAQRQREQLLMERGEQYMRAIQVYMKANNNQYPRNMEDLEKGQNRRYLRHKYIDPITLKDEWRIIHVQNGMLTDSIFTKKQDQEKSVSNPSSIGTLAGVAQTAGGPQAGSPLDRRRVNEGGMTSTATPGAPAPQNDDDATPSATAQNQQPGVPPGQPGQQPLPPGQPALGGQQPGVPGQMPPVPGGQVNPAVAGVASGGSLRPGAQPINPMYPPGQAGMPGQQPQNRQQTQTGSSSIGSLPGIGGGPVTNSNPSNSPQPFGGQPNTPLGQQAPVFGGQAPQPYPPQSPAGPGRGGPPQPGSANSALTAIQDQLTRPNPRGMAYVQQQQQQQQQQQTSAFGSGGAFGISGALAGAGAFIAGVASTAEYDAIMEYNGRTAYNEWEFVFDPAKAARVPQLGGTGAGGTPVGPGGSPVGQPGSPFGQSGSPSGQGGSSLGQMGGQMDPQFAQPGGPRPDQQPGRRLGGGNSAFGGGTIGGGSGAFGGGIGGSMGGGMPGGGGIGGSMGGGMPGGGGIGGSTGGGMPGGGGMQGGSQPGAVGAGQQGGAGAALPATNLRLGKP